MENEIKRLSAFVPPRGNIRILGITEKQYADMRFLIGKPTKTETMQSKQLLLF